jgi:hypothetical protein
MLRQIGTGLSLAALALTLLSKQATHSQAIATLKSGAQFVAFESGGVKGIAVHQAGSASVDQPKPAELEIYAGPGHIENKSTGYESLQASRAKARGVAHIAGPDGAQFAFDDEWSADGDVVELSRRVEVSGASTSSFLSAIRLSHLESHARSEVDYFAPGMIYGDPSHLSAGSIGGPLVYEGEGRGHVRIREDRLPAPVFGILFADRSALTVLDPAPKGDTTTADSRDTEIHTLTDERFRFGSLGADLDAGHHTQGFWFPGSEGEVTYRGNTYPGGQVHDWRRRYHPIRNGFVQQYRVQFRFSKGEDFSTYFKNAWRWAYARLKPLVTLQDISAARRSIIDVLASQVQIHDGRAGIPNFVPAVSDSERGPNHQAIMGFTGKNLEAAEFLLADAQIDSDKQRGAHAGKLGLAIFASFVRLKMNPPVGEGFNLETGEPALAIPRDRCIFLRSFGDDMKATLRTYHREKAKGVSHAEWLAWVKQFGDWLLTQQSAEGGFPRSWKPAIGEVLDASPQSSYNAIPLLVLLTEEMRDERYLRAAERAGEFVWSHGQAHGKFVGGTIDNPDVLDKEAGTLSNEAYLALYQTTHDSKWLSRARAAADFAETWIYIWNVPMPVDADDSQLHWKKGASTCGTQLIASGHSLVDDYMSFDVDEYAKLGRWTGDAHYFAVAELLLHNTKNMLALPGRTFDLKGPGWQQEHFSFAPIRGCGLHRLWLPWVATSQLNGIFGLREFDPALFKEWTKGNE